MRKLIAASGCVVALLLVTAGPAGAERAARSNGVGICISQLAIEPSILEASSLGEVMGEIAGPDLPAIINEDFELRNTCGEPPGPGHLR
jgi:hypothetical protein